MKAELTKQLRRDEGEVLTAYQDRRREPFGSVAAFSSLHPCELRL